MLHQHQDLLFHSLADMWHSLPLCPNKNNIHSHKGVCFTSPAVKLNYLQQPCKHRKANPAHMSPLHFKNTACTYLYSHHLGVCACPWARYCVCVFCGISHQRRAWMCVLWWGLLKLRPVWMLSGQKAWSWHRNRESGNTSYMSSLNLAPYFLLHPPPSYQATRSVGV